MRVFKLTISVIASAHLAVGLLPDRERVVKSRNESGHMARKINSRVLDHLTLKESNKFAQEKLKEAEDWPSNRVFEHATSPMEQSFRELTSTTTGCCSSYTSYTASAMCKVYGQDCSSGEAPSHDSGDASCLTQGLSFIGVSFSVNTARGNPLSYQLCDQLPMENLIDREYKYIMSMDEDGWLVGGGYKEFDYSGKMPYVDSSHTELLRIGNLDPKQGGTSISQVYQAMSTVSFTPLSIFPEYLKGPKAGGSGDKGENTPSGDITLIVSVAETFSQNNNYSDYELFLNALFSAMNAVGGGPCMDDHDTDPHVSMARGLKFKSSYHQYQYMYSKNMEVAVWQKMYPYGVVIGSSSTATFPINSKEKPSYVGYGNLYFFYDRANITKAFPPNRELSYGEKTYATFLSTASNETLQGIYQSVTYIPFNWQKQSGSRNKNTQTRSYEHNPYNWKASMAIHDQTYGWDLPPNCQAEGETFFGIPLSRKSDSKLQSTQTFQEQFDFSTLCDHNYTYVVNFKTNHGWLPGEHYDNSAGSIVDKDTANIPIFHMGTTDPDMGGMTLSNMIKVAKTINFGTIYIKPAFVFSDPDSGHLKLQFEADPDSALGYLYDSLCQALGITWNNNKPENQYGLYTNCAMHSSGDRASYGCGPTSAKTGGFCPQMTIAMRPKFKSTYHASLYLEAANNMVDYWRQKYPSGVAVGSSDFCPNGGCMGLFLNRMDVYQIFKPDLAGSTVAFSGLPAAGGLAVSPSTITSDTGENCQDEANWNLEGCFRESHSGASATWSSFGPIGQMCAVVVTAMSATLGISLFLARARRKMKSKETYWSFFLRDVVGRKKKKLGKKKVAPLEEDDFSDGESYYELAEPVAKSSKKSKKSRSGSRTRSRSNSRTVKVGNGGKDEREEKLLPTRPRSRSSKDRGRSRSINSRKQEPTLVRARSQSGTRSQSRTRSENRTRSQSRSRAHSQSRTRSHSRARSHSRSRTVDSDAISARSDSNDSDSIDAQEQENRRQLV